MTELRDQLQQTLGSAFTVERELGGGGMSRVLVAHDNTLGRKVVIKVLPPELAATVSNERFRREIMLAAALQHPHIIGVLSTGEIDGLPYFMMPFVDGESLRSRIERGPLGIPETVRILRDVARALAYAHERGIVHRDIKPDNVLISSGSAAVADFGVAKAIAASAGRRERPERGLALSAAEGREMTPQGTLTVIGTSLGTPTYMAPEQAAADPATDHRADIYAFGVMAYEMLTGAPPFRASSPRALLAAQLTEIPKPLVTHRKEIPQALSDVVMRCLEKDPDHRPQSAAELVAALDDPAVISGAFVAAPWASGAGYPGVAPRRRWMTPAIVVAAIVATLGGVALWQARTTVAPPPPPPPAAAEPARSIAVLPLVHIGADSTDAYFAQGMTEELTSRLGRVKGLRVASRTAALSVRDKNASVAEIGKLLNVTSLLEGTVQRDRGRLRLTARLINVADGFTLWSDVYESEVKDIFAVQDEISQAIVAALGEELGATGPAAAGVDASPPSVEAYNQYLRGRFFLDRRGDESLRKALEHFQLAVKSDSTYAPAYAGMADAYTLLPLYGRTRGEDVWPLALRAADRALALDSTLVEGYAARGNVHNATWRWSEAERDLRRAIALRPGYASAHQWLGENLLVNGRLPEAIVELKRASELDPVSPIVAGSYALALGVSRQFDTALVRARQAVDLDPELFVTRFMLGTIHLYAGHKADAIRDLEAALALGNGPVMVKGMLGYAYAAAGEREKALAILRELESTGTEGNGASARARIYLGLGDHDRTFEWLGRAVALHDSFFTSESLASPIFDPIRRDPRFVEHVRKVGLSVR